MIAIFIFGGVFIAFVTAIFVVEDDISKNDFGNFLSGGIGIMLFLALIIPHSDEMWSNEINSSSQVVSIELHGDKFEVKTRDWVFLSNNGINASDYSMVASDLRNGKHFTAHFRNMIYNEIQFLKIGELFEPRCVRYKIFEKIQSL